LTDEVVTLILAKDLRHVGAGGGVAGERITVHVIPVATAEAWLAARAAAGGLIDHKIWAALWFSRGEPFRPPRA
jgi:ADP-ribose pyrophosphatase